LSEKIVWPELELKVRPEREVIAKNLHFDDIALKDSKGHESALKARCAE
jgi:hypothetical protein